MIYFTGKLRVQQWKHLLDLPLRTHFFHTMKKKNWLHSCPQRFKPVFYRRYVDDIFVLFKSNDYLKYFQEFLNALFYRDRKKTKFSFLDVVVIHEQGKFTTRIYRISTFCGVYSIVIVKNFTLCL